MKSINKKIQAGLLLIVAGMLFSSCYKKFDAGSYAPAFTINGFSSVKEIQPSSLVAYWGFNGDFTDSVSAAAGTNNKTTFVDGFIGKGLSLSVANKSYVTFNPGTSITGLKSFTVSFWVNPTFLDLDNDGKIDGILGLFTLANTKAFWGNIDFFVENGSSTSSATVKAHIYTSGKDTWIDFSYPSLFGAWSNHTLTYDAASSKFTYYVNGSAIKTATASWTGDAIFIDNGPVIFGTAQFQTTPSYGTAGSPQSWASYLSGSLDEVRIYNKALTVSEVNAMVVLQGKGK